jgi:hypothetical protein
MIHSHHVGILPMLLLVSLNGIVKYCLVSVDYILHEINVGLNR